MQIEPGLIPTRNLALELVRVTEVAALAAARQFGRGDKNNADKAAVDAMRLVLNTIQMDGVIIIGEGEKDHAPMLYCGEKLGTGEAPLLDLAVDPVEGTTLVANGQSNAIAVIAAAPRGSMFDPGPVHYMDKLAVGAAAKDVIDIEAPVRDNLERVAHAKGMDVRDLTVVILDRPRHESLVAEVRRCGARIRLITAGDVAGAMMTAWQDSGIDLLMGIGGSPEAVLAACAMRAMGGAIQAKLAVNDHAIRQKVLDAGYKLDKVLHTHDLVASDDVFFAATGISDGEVLKGVIYHQNIASTHSLVMRGLTQTTREITAHHNLDQLAKISPIHY